MRTKNKERDQIRRSAPRRCRPPDLERKRRGMDERRRESSPEIDMDRAGIDSVEWLQEQIELQRLARPTDKQKVAYFVKLVEKAFQYFDFKDFLSKRYGLEECAKYGSALAHILRGLPSQMNKFDALSSYDIRAAVEAHISSLKRSRWAYISSLEQARQHHNEDAKSDTAPPSPPKDPLSSLLDQLKEEDFYAFSAPTFRAVFLARNRLYDMDLCPKKELQKIESSPGYRPDYVFFYEPAAKWSEKGGNAAIVAKKYEEACNKYRSLVLGLSKEVKASKERRMSVEKRKREQHEVKAPKERRMSDEKRKREQHAEEEEEDGGKGEKGVNAVTVAKKAPKERRTSDEKRKGEQHAEEEEGGKGEKGANTAIVVKKYEEGANVAIALKKYEEACNKYREEGANVAIALKKYEEACNKYRSIVLEEVKAPKERRTSDKKQKLVERHARRVQKCPRH